MKEASRLRPINSVMSGASIKENGYLSPVLPKRRKYVKRKRLST